MKKLYYFLLLFLYACNGGGQYVDQPQDIILEDIVDNGAYLLIGQSNMVGQGYIGDYTGGIEGVTLLNDEGDFVQASNPLNRFSNVDGVHYQGVGPGYSFAIEMAKQKDVKLIVNARSGSSVSCWSEGGLCYNGTMQRTKGIKVRAILWHQGETAVVNDNHQWLQQFIELVQDYREIYGDIPIVVGQLGQWNTRSEWFNDMVLTIPLYIENSYVVTTEGLTGDDEWHFDIESQIEFGIRYADVVTAYVPN